MAVSDQLNAISSQLRELKEYLIDGKGEFSVSIALTIGSTCANINSVLIQTVLSDSVSSSKWPTKPSTSAPSRSLIQEPPKNTLVLTKDAKEERIKHKKDFTLVSIGKEETKDEDLMQEVMEKLDEDEKKKIEKVFRLPKKNPDQTYPMPVKIVLTTCDSKQKEAIRFKLFKFARFTRGDYCREELDYDRCLRTWASEKNKAIGWRAYTVRDLQIVLTPRGNYMKENAVFGLDSIGEKGSAY